MNQLLSLLQPDRCTSATQLRICTVKVTDYKLAPPRGRSDGATWAPWAERLVPFLLEVNKMCHSNGNCAIDPAAQAVK
jgi:hypothetical protein